MQFYNNIVLKYGSVSFADFYQGQSRGSKFSYCMIRVDCYEVDFDCVRSKLTISILVLTHTLASHVQNCMAAAKWERL